jgi:hypothetical protein
LSAKDDPALSEWRRDLPPTTITAITTTMKEEPRRHPFSESAEVQSFQQLQQNRESCPAPVPTERDAAVVAVRRLGHGDKRSYDSCRHLRQK